MSRRGSRHDRHRGEPGGTAFVVDSALDAHVRHFRVAIPTDAVAAIYDHLAEPALEMMERNLSAELCAAADCSLE